jgi:polysaccharide deacetylase 2 family uncharacterized protein YibQ
VLPPPELPPPAPESAEAPTVPQVINGIEVSNEPAYSGGSATEAAAPVPAPPDTGTQATAEEGVLAPVELSGPAFSINAEPFDAAAAEKPLVAVILADTASNPFLHEMLFSIRLPLTVGVVAGGGGDSETAAAARAAGFEVVAELPVATPGAATGAMLEYGMDEAGAAIRTLTLMQRLPMAVAASRAQTAIELPGPAVLKGIVDTLMPLGFAYVDHGLAPGARSTFAASGLDMPIGVSRFSIPPGASPAQIISILDRAAADAVERGGAVVFAPPDEQVLLALQLWGDAGAGNVAALAPLSAVIRRQNSGG